MDLVTLAFNIIVSLLPVLVSLSFLVFIWGIVKFISKSSTDKGIEEGKALIVWGLIALFVLLSFSGIIHFFSRDVFGDIQFPILPTS